VDNANNMLGLLTDGDIRRSLYDNSDLKIITDEIINKNYFYLTDTNKRIIDIDVKKYKFIPILDNNKIIGLFDYYSCM
jgi:CBS domain-containing protein